MEKLIIYGCVYSFTSKKSGDNLYKLDYLDCTSGRSKSDYLTYDEYINIKNKNIPIGTNVIGICSSDIYDRLYVSSISVE